VSVGSGRTARPPGLARAPLVSDWIAMPPARVFVRVGKVELGQGITTALAQIAAEELDVAAERVSLLTPSTATSPDEGTTSGSRSIMDSGSALRCACAEARLLLVRAAARLAGLSPAGLSVRDGQICSADGNPVANYWELASPELFAHPISGTAPVKTPARHRIVGSSLPRRDLPAKFAGAPRFIHDLRAPGVRFGRVVRPPAPGARLLSVDPRATRAQPGVVAVVRRGSFLGVIAELEEQAIAAAERLRADASWSQPATLPDAGRLPEWLRAQPAEEILIERAAGSEPPAAGSEIRRSYSRHYLAHASIAPSAAMARWDGPRVTVWTHSQGIYPLRAAIADALSLAPGDVLVHHVDGCGCYGHNGADDAAFDAVLLARQVPGVPVHVTWSREDEFAWEPYGAAMVADVRARVDDAGNLLGWRQDIWSNGHHARPGYAGQPGLLGDWHAADRLEPPPADDPDMAAGGGIARNGVPAYSIPHKQITAHRVLTMPVRTSSLRSLGAMINVFSIESMIDELAQRAGVDPVEYRIRHLSDERAAECLRTVARLARWAERRQEESVGWGVAYARYKNSCAHCAVVAVVEAETQVRVRTLYLAVDAGQIINPDGLRNQMEGGAIQATSWTVREQVRFAGSAIASRDWDSYPILRFSEVPAVQVELISRPDEPSLGVGECAVGPVAAAIGNALCDAIGLRVRDLPLSPANIVAAMAES
jgi:CO/xanthine dehydrogenase Mo-binding subunit